MKNPLSIEAFLDWVEKQPAEKEYDYENNGECAFAQYLAAVGFDGPSVGSHTWWCIEDGWPSALRDMPQGIDDAVHDIPATFGALASRLRASLKETGE